MTSPSKVPMPQAPFVDPQTGYLTRVGNNYLNNLTLNVNAGAAGSVTTAPGSGLSGGGTVADGISLIIAPNGVSDAMIRQSAAYSVIGRAFGTAGNVADITATADNRVLARIGGVLAFWDAALVPGAIADGNYGDVTVSVGGTVITINSHVVSNAKFRQSPGLSVVGRASNSVGDVADIAAGSDGQVLVRNGTVIAFDAVNLASTNAITGDLPFANLTQGTARSVLAVAGNATADFASIQGSASQFLGINAAGTVLAFQTMSGDATLSAGAITLATVNANTGAWGSATQVAQVTLDAKGRATAAANVTITPAVGSITGLGTGVATALAINVGSAGAFVTFNGAGGAPSSITLTNATGLPVSTGISGLGTGVATALAVNVGSAGAFVTFNGALGTPSSGTATNLTGLPISTGVSGLGAGVATFLATPSSANLLAALTTSTGTGTNVFSISPTFTGTANFAAAAATGAVTGSTLGVDANYYLTIATSNPNIVFDANDSMVYNRGANTLAVLIGSSTVGSFGSGGLTATLIGNASTATAWATGRTITTTGDATGVSGSFDGSANLSFALTIPAGTVTLAKMADIATAKVIGRMTAGTGVPEALSTTGTGNVVFSTSPTLVTPILGTPTSGTLTNATGLPIAGLVASTVTAIGVGSIELGNASDTTIARVSAGVISVEGVNILASAATGIQTFLTTPSSANLIAAVTDETGTGALVFATSPSLVTPILGTPTSGTLTNCTGLPIAGLVAAAWTSWTPTWTNVTIGNATVTAKYLQIGKGVWCRLSVVLGTTTSISGGIRFSFPVTAVSFGGTATFTPLGTAQFYDQSADTLYMGVVSNQSTTEGLLRALNASATYLVLNNSSATVPYTWTTSDEIECEFFYEAA